LLLFSAELPEDTQAGQAVKVLDVNNPEEDRAVDCFFVSGNEDGKSFLFFCTYCETYILKHSLSLINAE